MSKAVFIDGAALNYMIAALGIERIAFKQLKAILLSEVGAVRRFAAKPVITISPSWALAAGPILAEMGYETITTASANGQDDERLIERIESVTREKVTTIVFVGSDSDFLPILRRKAAEGFVVYVVATKITERGKRPSIGAAMQEAIEKGELRFVDLAPHASQLEYIKNGAGAQPGVQTIRAVPHFVLELVGGHESYPEITNAVFELQQRFAGKIKARFEPSS